MKSIHKIQQEMEANQNHNSDVVKRQFEVFNITFHVLRDCTQLIYTQQQLNVTYGTVAALLLFLCQYQELTERYFMPTDSIS